MTTKAVLVIHGRPEATHLLRQVFERAGAKLPAFVCDEPSLVFDIVNDEDVRSTRERLQTLVTDALGVISGDAVEIIVTVRS